MNSNLIGVLVGGLIAILGSVAVTVLTPWLNHRRDRRVLEASLASEVSAIIDLISYRKIEKILDESITCSELKATLESPGMEITADYFKIYNNNLSRIGLLSPASARDVVRFYTYATAFIEGVNYVSSEEAKLLELEDAIAELRYLRKLLADAVQVGEQIRDKMSSIQAL